MDENLISSLTNMYLTHFVFVYSKSEYTIESISMSGRLHDNSRKTHSIVMKFLPQLHLIDILVEFEDGQNRPTY